MNLLRRFLRWLYGVEPQSDSLAIAAEYVAAELLAYIDTSHVLSGETKGWAQKYRGHFRFDHTAFTTLGDALDALRDALPERNRVHE